MAKRLPVSVSVPCMRIGSLARTILIIRFKLCVNGPDELDEETPGVAADRAGFFPVELDPELEVGGRKLGIGREVRVVVGIDQSGEGRRAGGERRWDEQIPVVDR